MGNLEFSAHPVVDDWDLFITFLTAREQIPVTNDKANLKRDDLFRLNEELHYKASWVTNKSMQFSYPELDFFYYVVLASKMAAIRYDEKITRLHLNAERLEQYAGFTRTEKYFFLLESAWCYVNWAKLNDSRAVYYADSVTHLFGLIAESEVGQELVVKENRLIHPPQLKPIYFGGNNKIVQLFWFMGFYDLIPNAALQKKPDRYTFGYEKIITKELGKQLATVLLNERPLELWNKPLRRYLGTGEVPLGLTEEEFYKDNAAGEWVPRPGDTLNIPDFVDAFKPLVPTDELIESFYKKENIFIGGRYTLRVLLTPGIYRTMALGASATLEDLHGAIQDAFKFDDDHLYAFYMDGERYSDEAYNDPRGEEGPFASDVKLGELELTPGQRFLYLFDFGDNWEFWVTVLEINPEQPELAAPKIIDKKGKAPKQYRW